MLQGRTSNQPQKFLLEDQGRYAVTLAQDGLRGSLLVRNSDWDLVYVPTLNHPAPSLPLIQEDVMSEATGAPAVYAYDPGDSTADSHPTAFVRVVTTLDQKLEALDSFGASRRTHLSADRVALGARFWGRFKDRSLAEPFEVIRGDPRSQLGAGSLLPAEESKLV